MYFLVNSIPKELKEEIVKYCRDIAFVLQSTGMFSVSEQMSLNSFYYICEIAARYGNLPLLQWARKRLCPWNTWVCVKKQLLLGMSGLLSMQDIMGARSWVSFLLNCFEEFPFVEKEIQ